MRPLFDRIREDLAVDYYNDELTAEECNIVIDRLLRSYPEYKDQDVYFKCDKHRRRTRLRYPVALGEKPAKG